MLADSGGGYLRIAPCRFFFQGFLLLYLAVELAGGDAPRLPAAACSLAQQHIVSCRGGDEEGVPDNENGREKVWRQT